MTQKTSTNPYSDWIHGTQSKKYQKAKKDTIWYLFGTKNLLLVSLKTKGSCFHRNQGTLQMEIAMSNKNASLKSGIRDNLLRETVHDFLQQEIKNGSAPLHRIRLLHHLCL